MGELPGDVQFLLFDRESPSPQYLVELAVAQEKNDRAVAACFVPQGP
jgi:hypothetical protein